MTTIPQTINDLRGSYHAIGIAELEVVLRQKIQEDRTKHSLRQIADKAGVSKTYLDVFAKGQDVCIKTMNGLANYYHVSYVIENF